MNLVFSIVGIVASVVGFLACATLFIHARHDPFPGVNRMPLTRWGGNFFIGSAILLVDCAMGDRAPFPVVASFSGSFGLGSVAFCWLLLCAAGFAVANALEVRRRHERRARSCFPFRIGAAVLLLTGLAFTTGCGVDGRVEAMTVAGDATQISAAYFGYQQGIINTMKPGPDRDEAQAKLYSRENTAGLVSAIGSIVVKNAPAPMPVVVPTTQPVP